MDESGGTPGTGTPETGTGNGGRSGGDGGSGGGPEALKRQGGFWGAVGVMLGIIIGSGIFQTPIQIAGLLDSGGLILAMWVLGGLLALCGAFTYAELAAMLPESGGIYVFLREAYGRAMAFVFGWSYLLLSKPFAAGGIAIVFATHFKALLGVETIFGLTAMQTDQAITIAVLTLLTVVNVLGVRISTGVAGVLTVLKVAALVAVVAAGLLLWGRGSAENFTGGAGLTVGAKPLLGALVATMAAVLWTYDGWSDVGAIAGEVKDPGRTLPRVYVVGTLLIIAVYVGVNAAYLWHLPLRELRADGVDTIAPLFMERVLAAAGWIGSAAGALLITVVVVLSTLGSSHGSIMTGARVTFQQARDGLMFAPLGRVHPRRGTPAVSLWVQLVLSCVGVLIYGNFGDLSGGFVFTMWIFYGLAGGAIFLLRRRRPDAVRPFRCPGYPWVPGIFVLSAAVMTVLTVSEGIRAGQWDALVWTGVLLAGVPVYVVWERWQRRAAA